MPFLNRDSLTLFLLISCVPIQFWLVQQSSVTNEQRSSLLLGHIKYLNKFAQKWTSFSAWKDWLVLLKRKLLYKDYSMWYPFNNDPDGVCPAVEVFYYENSNGYFGTSPEPRKIRPPNVKYRVGQVVYNILGKYKGVIIGWDETCKQWEEQPAYAILANTGDQLVPEIAYVVQEFIEAVSYEMIDNSKLTKYFEYFDGIQYIPHKWLQAIYPMD